MWAPVRIRRVSRARWFVWGCTGKNPARASPPKARANLTVVNGPQLSHLVRRVASGSRGSSECNTSRTPVTGTIRACSGGGMVVGPADADDGNVEDVVPGSAVAVVVFACPAFGAGASAFRGLAHGFLSENSPVVFAGEPGPLCVRCECGLVAGGSAGLV